ncbi:hypothetical protein [Lysinibacillus xylanilyticus]|uniref:hypothetical protein n=1 Tax=Lysinibacillus xylanilyticus TaxID=582475 RepID=UPI0036DDDF4D
MYTRGNRVYYETETGRIVFQNGEITNSTDPIKHDPIKGLSYVDFDIGAIDWKKHSIERINPQTKQPVLKDVLYTKSPQEQRIDELTEENMLLKSNAEIDGLM